MRWIRRAARLPGKAFHLGMAIWQEALCIPARNPVVKLPRRKRKWFGLERRAFYRALRALREAGLIDAEARKGKVPLITIRDVPAMRDEGADTG
jgi:DNA-binding transcriptional ArsR family regulator